MVRQAGHKHDFRIISHTTKEKGKNVRVLLGCKCSAVDVIKPHQGRKTDPAFFEKLNQYEHVCCGGSRPDVPVAA